MAKKSYVLGFQTGIYVEMGGDYANPIWREIIEAKNVTPNMERELVDVTTNEHARTLPRVKAQVATLADGTIEIEATLRPGSDVLDLIDTAFEQGQPVDILDMRDGLRYETGAKGTRGWYTVGNFTPKKETAGVVTVSIKLAPTLSPDGNLFQKLTGPIESEDDPTVSITTTPTPATGAAPLTVAFVCTATSGSGGTISGYLWDFGDGRTGEGASVSHKYYAAGTYTATVTAIDTNTCGKQATATVTVS